MQALCLRVCEMSHRSAAMSAAISVVMSAVRSRSRMRLDGVASLQGRRRRRRASRCGLSSVWSFIGDVGSASPMERAVGFGDREFAVGTEFEPPPAVVDEVVVS